MGRTCNLSDMHTVGRPENLFVKIGPDVVRVEFTHKSPVNNQGTLIGWFRGRLTSFEIEWL